MANPSGVSATLKPEDKLALDQLRLALRNLTPSMWTTLVAVPAMWFIFARWVSFQVLLLWGIMVVLGRLPIGIVARRFFQQPPDHLNARKWTLLATGAYLILACTWVSMALLFWRRGNDLDNLLIMMFLCAALASNGGLVGSSRPLAACGVIVFGSALILTPLRNGDVVFLGLAAVCALIVALLAFAANHLYQTTRDMLLLRADKDDLIEALAKSKAQSDDARARAEAASRAKSEFLANMSHELRTPLNAILGFSEMIQSPAFGNDLAKNAQYAQVIHQSGHHLLTLIDDILDLAKIEAGGFRLSETDFDLAGLIRNAIELMAAKARAGHVALVIENGESNIHIRADERAIRQIMLNLLSNALKFTPPGGRVTLFVRRDAENNVVFGVEDTGCGIRDADQALVFESFGQGRHDVATPEKGTGLGLPIVKGLVLAHDGRVALESAEGKGTRVTVILPSARFVDRAAMKVAS